ncbi:DUF4198 domain-containing protein [Amphibacillus cookii]|uniref:DUF4198 domain-containing protein n=1 Tax=Amphibacillus cookii TaxID=767787 RepID=UPI00195AD394|nr:DUF4198 domain-containing protein [Amphibacillus cookii]MBM7542372.1 putative GH25 family protein [Amphibacillus cookii]
MKKVLISLFVFAIFFLITTPTLFAHELFIQVKELSDSQELRVDIKWGHIRDNVSESEPEDYRLYVRYPDGNQDQLDLEAAGVYARAIVPIQDQGEYIFWAERALGTYSPDDQDFTQLSSHMAKTVHIVGDGEAHADSPVGLALEIVPTTDLSSLSSGKLEGIVELDKHAIEEATIMAYGPEDEVIEEVTDQNGNFTIELDSAGEWLIKANVVLEEAGVLDEDDYDRISHTSTLLLDINEDEQIDTSIWALIGMLIVGLLIGSTITLVAVKRNLNSSTD